MSERTTVPDLLDAAWTASALAKFLEGGVDQQLSGDEAFVPLLVRAGLVEKTADGYVFVDGDRIRGSESMTLAGLRSTLGQAYAIAAGRQGWAAHDEGVLEAQGIASSIGGRGLAQGIRALPDLASTFADGGVLLDVGVGVAGLACAFCEALPNAKVIGLDVLPEALRLAEKRIHEKQLGDRIELRQVGVELFDEHSVADLAHMSPIFIPPAVLAEGLRRIHDALKPGGALFLSGIVGDDAAGATTRWMAHNAGGTAMTYDDAARLAAETGFAEPVVPDVPPGSPRVLLLHRVDLPAEGGARA